MDTIDALRHTARVALTIADLDRDFRLKARTAVALAFPLIYGQFGARIDVAGLRAAGYGSLLTDVEYVRAGGPLAVGGPLDVVLEIRQAELAGGRLGFECRYAFASPPGTGDPRRYREVVDGTPAPAGTGRLVLTLLRTEGPPAGRLVREPLPQTAHLRVHPLDPPGELTAAPDGLDEVTPAGDATTGWFGLQHTDTNQYVFSAELLRLLEDHATALVGAAGLPVGGHTVERVAATFKRPFAAGDRFAVRGRLWHRDGRTVAVVGIHAVTGDGEGSRPAVLGRLDGTLA